MTWKARTVQVGLLGAAAGLGALVAISVGQTQPAPAPAGQPAGAVQAPAAPVTVKPPAAATATDQPAAPQPAAVAEKPAPDAPAAPAAGLSAPSWLPFRSASHRRKRKSQFPSMGVPPLSLRRPW